MNIEETLTEIGLSDGEIKVYLALLKLGSSPVSKIKEETTLHRTTIYDFVEKLLNKGLLNHVTMGGTKHFKATNPDKLLDYIKYKEDKVKQAIPQLEALQTLQLEEISVEIHKGKEGFKTLISEIIREKSNLLGFGIEEQLFQDRFPHLMQKLFREEKRLGLNERLLASESTKFYYKQPLTKYKFLPENYFNPTPTFIFGKKVAIINWEPLTIIIIKNESLADSYRKHFELLWKIGKEKK